MRTSYVCPVLFVLLALTSCSVIDHVGNLQFEVMRPGLITIPKNVERVAVLYNDSLNDKSNTFLLFDGRSINADTTIQPADLYRISTDSFENKLAETGYFKTIRNYQDSLPFGPVSQIGTNQLFEKTKADLCIILKYIRFYQARIAEFDFQSTIPAEMKWLILFRNDTTIYTYNQIDTLIYDFPTYKALTKDNTNKPLIENASGYMGKTCASKLIPDWIPIERMYYKSANPEMLKAEQYALNNNWMSAAEIWNRISENKNKQMAAKAAFNMGLACEMEGKPELAIDWVLQSANQKIKYDIDLHRINCQRYIVVLNKRIKDIEQLNRQIREIKLTAE